MNRYGGQLIHQSHDEVGVLEIIENGYQRSLHFGSEPKQSSMDLNNPLRLCLSYTRAMLCGLLFKPEPRHILLIGLGGGSLAKFFLHHFPHCQIDAVEVRQHVTKLAHAYFGLPETDRLTIHHRDAAQFIHRQAINGPAYDLILVDAFTAEGMAQAVGSEYFFAGCAERLSADGVLSCNLWGHDQKRLKLILENLRLAQIGRRPLLLPVEGKDNIISLSVANALPQRQLKRLKNRAIELQSELDIEFPALLRQLQKTNRWPF